MRALIGGLALALAALVPAAADDAAEFTEPEEEAIRTIVREYLLEHPEVIEEAIYELQRQREARRTALQRAAIAANDEALFHDPRDFAIGPADAPVQIVEFFDYNCPYCRSSAPWVKRMIDEHGDQIRFIFKEAPIFASSRESSDLGARVAVEAAARGKYLDFHFTMMDSSGTLPVARVRQIAEEVGLNWNRVERAIESPETTQQLEDGLDLLAEIGGDGTPAFVLEGELIQGAATERLERTIRDILGEGE